MTTATTRTLEANRKLGRICDMAERWVPAPHIPGGGYRKDAFGFIDVLALDPVDGIVAIQSFTTAFTAHVRKLMGEDPAAPDVAGNAIAWLRAGGRIELWGWRKLKVKRGGKAERWVPRVQAFTLADFEVLVQ